MSKGYTQQELLLLSNFVYIPACLSDMTIKDVLDSYKDTSGHFTSDGIARAAAGGGMSREDVRTVFEQMDKAVKKDPGFGQLSPGRRLETEHVRAVCYTDPKDENPVLVFRGTGGTKEAWTDNFEGAFREETDIQHLADEFVRHECAIYPEMVVTGHSKGGNLAQYVTVTQNSRISKCVSFDGQGFGDDLIRSDPDAVKAASPKICSVCAYNDFVNILLTSIAGTCIYVENEASLAGAHSSVTLLTNNTFDENGNFTSTRSQNALCAMIKHMTDGIVDVLDPFPEHDKEAMSDVAGLAISDALNAPAGRIAEDCIAPALGTISAQLVKRYALVRDFIYGDEPVAAENVKIDTVMIDRAVDDIRSYVTVARSLIPALEDIRQDPAFTLSARIYTAGSLTGALEDLKKACAGLERYCDKLSVISKHYEDAERRALSLLGL